MIEISSLYVATVIVRYCTMFRLYVIRVKSQRL